MKKPFKRMICAAVAAVAVLGASACSLEPLSAYDIAVKYQGFQGTETEWLDSLKGSDGANAPSLTIEEIYAAWSSRAENEGKSFNDFLSQYLSVSYNENNDTQQIAQNLTSAVSVYCGMWSYDAEDAKYKWGIGAGSGVLFDVDANGNAYVVTNYHVVYESTAKNGERVDKKYDNGDTIVDNSNIFLYLYGVVGYDYLAAKTDGSGYKDVSDCAVSARYVGGSMAYDVAILQIEGDETLKNAVQNGVATSAKFAKNGVTVGEKVYAVGNASGEGLSVSVGAVSVESETLTMYAADNKTPVNFHVLRTDTAINPGNSGGGLFNASGELVGIVNAKSVSSSGGTAVENMGYALPVSDVAAVADAIIYYAKTTGAKGTVYKPYFGITPKSVTAETSWNDTKDALVVTETVKLDSVSNFGANVGLGVGKFKEGDRLTAVKLYAATGDLKQNIVVRNVYDFTLALLWSRPGDKLEISVKRGTADLTLIFENLKASDFVAADMQIKGQLVRLG